MTKNKDTMITRNWVRLHDLRDRVRRTRLKVYLWQVQSVLSDKEGKNLESSRDHLSRAERILESVLWNRIHDTASKPEEEVRPTGAPKKTKTKTGKWRTRGHPPSGEKVLMVVDWDWTEGERPAVVMGQSVVMGYYSRPRKFWASSWSGEEITGNVLAWRPVPKVPEELVVKK